MPGHVLPTRVATVAAVFLLAGCASNQSSPDQQLSTAEAAITQAESAGARDAAPRLLKQANDKVDDARGLMDKEKYEQAERLLEEAAADARLAGERARTDKSEQAVQQLNETIEMLRDRMMEEQS